jgi:glycosyltransferase involved in cell wall biosynthesis
MGNFFEGYGYTRKRKETWNGIDIIRLPIIPRGKCSISMMANYASFAISGYVENILSNIKADYVFTFEVSPMTQALVGCWYAKKHHVPHYLYVQDLWPENVVTVTGISNPIIINLINKMVDYIYKNSNEIFVTSPSFADVICNRKVKVNRIKVHYWPQYAEEFYFPVDKKEVSEIPSDESFKIIFTGNIGTAQGLQILPKTAELILNENVKFVMVGDGRYLSEFNNEVKKRGVSDKFIMIPSKPAERIPELLAACDAAFLSFQDADLWTMTIPAKLQSYMACGMPIIASAQGETERIINEAECGICCKIGDSVALANAINELMKNEEIEVMGKKSRRYFESHLDKQVLMDQIEVFFK